LVENNNIEGKGAISIAEALRSNRILTKLNLSTIIKEVECNDIGTEGGVAIAELLQINNTLLKLNLGSFTFQY